MGPISGLKLWGRSSTSPPRLLTVSKHDGSPDTHTVDAHTVNSSQPIHHYCNHEYWCTIVVVAILFRNDGMEIYSKTDKMKAQ